MKQEPQRKRALLGRVSDTDLRLLRVFLAVVRCGGLTAAELELNIGRSTISRHLKDLEIRIGATLCHRGRSGFRLTGEGERVHAAARRLVAAVDSFHAEVGEVHDQIRGHLRIAVFDKMVTNQDAHLPAALRQFDDSAPDVSLALHVEPTNQIETGVIEGDFQVGIIPTHRESPSLRYFPLFSEQMRLYCGRHHPFFNKADSDIQEWKVRTHKYAGMGFHSPNMRAAHRLRLPRSADAFDQEAVAALVLSGRYLGFLPDHYADRFVQEGLVRPVLSEQFEYRCEFAAIVKASPQPNRIVEILLDCLLDAHGKPRQ